MARVSVPKQQPPAATDFGKKVQAHQRYYASDGTQVPGVTTVLGVLAKPALVAWANRLGLQGVDTNKYVDEAAAVGTLAHYMVECRLQDKEPELDDFTPAQVTRAEKSFGNFVAWLESHRLEPKLVEYQMVSDHWLYGGTIDCYGLLDEVPTLLDFKTSSGIYDEHRYQVSAYWNLLREAGHPVKGVRVLRIGRDGEGLEEHVISGEQVLQGWKVFQAALAIHRLTKQRRKSA